MYYLFHKYQNQQILNEILYFVHFCLYNTKILILWPVKNSSRSTTFLKNVNFIRIVEQNYLLLSFLFILCKTKTNYIDF